MPERIYKLYIGEELVAEWKGAKTMDKTCNNCICNKVCNHDLFGFENCGNFMPADDSKGEYLHLPCKVGDFVYEPRPDRGFVSVYKITAIRINKNDLFFYWELIDGIYSYIEGFDDSVLGKTVFLSREEAEKVLDSEK